jgi:hypothetical protein
VVQPAAPAPPAATTGTHPVVPAARPLPTGTNPVVRPAPAAPAAAPPAGEPHGAASDDLLGAIPRGGFAPEGPLEELTPTPSEEYEAVLATDLAPHDELEEMPEGRVPIRELTARDVAILDALDRLAAGIEDPASPLKPARLAAALLRLLLAKKLVNEQELLDELSGRG